VREIRRARHAAGLNLLHEVSEWPITLRADLAYVGERDDRDFATFPATDVTLDDFVTLGVAMTWRVRPGFDLFARGDGVLTQNYEDVFGYASPGQTLRVGFEYRMR
jgi:vitamin B12 transporter